MWHSAHKPVHTPNWHACRQGSRQYHHTHSKTTKLVLLPSRIGGVLLCDALMHSSPQAVTIRVMHCFVEEDDCRCCHGNTDTVGDREVTSVGVKRLVDVSPGNSLCANEVMQDFWSWRVSTLPQGGEGNSSQVTGWAGIIIMPATEAISLLYYHYVALHNSLMIHQCTSHWPAPTPPTYTHTHTPTHTHTHTICTHTCTHSPTHLCMCTGQKP